MGFFYKFTINSQPRLKKIRSLFVIHSPLKSRHEFLHGLVVGSLSWKKTAARGVLWIFYLKSMFTMFKNLIKWKNLNW